jgi:hypothetical protein
VVVAELRRQERRRTWLGLRQAAHDQRHLRHAQRLARFGAVEDHILHLLAPQSRLRALLAEHPEDGIHNVAFSGPVRPDDGGDTGGETDFGFGEGFEPGQFQGLEVHSVPFLSMPARLEISALVTQLAAKSKEKHTRR